MSRKDYNKIADAIHDCFGQADGPYSREQFILCLSNALKGTNPRYNSARFYNACLHGRRRKKRVKS